MTFTWADFGAAEPGFAARVRRRFERRPRHVLDTLEKTAPLG